MWTISRCIFASNSHCCMFTGDMNQDLVLEVVSVGTTPDPIEGGRYAFFG